MTLSSTTLFLAFLKQTLVVFVIFVAALGPFSVSFFGEKRFAVSKTYAYDCDGLEDTDTSFAKSLCEQRHVTEAAGNNPDPVSNYTVAGVKQKPIGGGPDEGSPFICGFSNLGGCVGSVIYYVFFKPAEYFIGFAGWFFDIMAAFTLSPKVIDQPFVRDTWAAVRDMANMLFIFALLAISIATILQVEQYNAKNMLAKLIILAVVINFSFFISRAIIDAGNITAFFFYKNIEAVGTNTNVKGVSAVEIKSVFKAKDGGKEAFGFEARGISGKLISAVKPQSAFSEKITKALAVSSPGTLIIFYIGVSIFFFVAGWAFFSIGLSFLTRVVALWILIIFSPLAFAASVLPSTSNYARQWWEEIFKKSFCVAIFLFFLFIISRFVGSVLITTTFADPSKATNVIYFLILSMLYYSMLLVLLKVAKDTTLKWCDEMGGHALGIGKKIAGLAGGALMLGAGGLATRTLGANWFKGFVEKEKGSRIGQFVRKNLIRRGVEGVSKASFGATEPFGKRVEGGWAGITGRKARTEANYADWLASGKGGKDRLKKYIATGTAKYDGVFGKLMTTVNPSAAGEHAGVLTRAIKDLKNKMVQLDKDINRAAQSNPGGVADLVKNEVSVKEQLAEYENKLSQLGFSVPEKEVKTGGAAGSGGAGSKGP
ncbi:MAG: hypothetical protein AAB819_00385 [Patescibacteria group bacterium]